MAPRPLVFIVACLLGSSCADETTPATDSTTDVAGSSSTGAPSATVTTADPGSDATGVGSSDAESSSTGVGSTEDTGSEGSESGSPEGCGDGVVQPPETCDDGNAIYGDGCSACAVSGTPIWTTLYDGANAEPRAIAVDDGDGIVLAGGETDGSVFIGLVQHYFADGNLNGSTTIPSPAAFTFTAVNGTCTGAGDRFYTAGAINDVSDAASMRHLRAYDGLAVAWTRDSTPGNHEAWWDCVVADGGPIFVGHERPAQFGPVNGVTTAFDADGDELWSQTVDSVALREIEVNPSGDLVLLGSGAAMTVLWLGADGTMLETREYPGYTPASLAVHDDGSIYVSALELESTLPWLAKLDADGDVLWSANPLESFGKPEGSTAPGLAIGPGGEGFVGGVFTDPGQQAWLAAFSSEGDPLAAGNFDTGLPARPSASIYDLAVTSDDALVLAIRYWDSTTDSYRVMLQKQVP